MPRELVVPRPGDLVVLLDPVEGAEIQVPDTRTDVQQYSVHAGYQRLLSGYQRQLPGGE